MKTVALVDRGVLLPRDAALFRDGALSLALPGDVAPVLVFFRGTRSELALDADEVPLLAEGRALPRPHSAFTAGDDGALTPISLGALHVAPIDWAAVVASGGCSKIASDPPAEGSPLLAVESPCAGGEDPALPRRPAPPVFAIERAGLCDRSTCCPRGWSPRLRSVEAVTSTSCAPPPAAGPCARGALQRAGDASCAPISECPADGWPAALPATGVRYVAPGPPGDGSRDAPHATIAEALVGAGAGTTIAVARGDYAENVLLPPGVRLAGACAAEVRIDAPEVRLEGASSVEGVELRGPIVVVPEATARITRSALAGRLDARGASEVTLEGTRLDGPLNVAAAARVAFEGGEVVGSTISAGGRAAELLLEGAAVRGSRLITSGGATTTLREVVVDRPRGIRAEGTGTRLVLADVAIRDPSGDPSCRPPRGAAVCVKDAALEASRLTIDAGAEITLDAAIAGHSAALTIADLALALSSKNGVFAGNAARLDLSRALLERSGVGLDEALPSAVRDVAARTSSIAGLDVEETGGVVVERVIARGSAIEPDVKLRGMAGTISDLEAGGGAREGILLRQHSEVSWMRVRVTAATRVGIAIDDETRTSFEDLTVTQSPRELCSGCFGAVRVLGASQVTLRRFALRDSMVSALWVGQGAVVRAIGGEIDGAEHALLLDPGGDPAPLLEGVRVLRVATPFATLVDGVPR